MASLGNGSGSEAIIARSTASSQATLPLDLINLGPPLNSPVGSTPISNLSSGLPSPHKLLLTFPRILALILSVNSPTKPALTAAFAPIAC